MPGVLSKNKPERRRWGTLLIFIFAITILAYFVFSLLYRGGDVSLSFDMPDAAVIGTPTDVTVILQNNSGGILRDVSVALVVPNGVSFVGNGTTARRTEEKGVIEPGETVKETFTIIITNDASDSRELRAEALYAPEKLGQKLLTSKINGIAVKKPIALTLTAPASVPAGEGFEWRARLKNESDREWRVFLTAEFSEGIFIELPEEEITIPRGGEETRVFSGTALLEDRTEAMIVIKVTGMEDGVTILTEESFILRAGRSALGLEVSVNKEANVIAFPGGELQYTAVVKNAGGMTLPEVLVEASLSGSMFNLKSLASSGRILSGGERIVWDSETTQALQSFKPGDEITLPFAVRVKDGYDIRNFSDKNFVLGVDIKAQSAPVSAVATRSVGIARLRTKVAGKLSLSQKMLYRDAASGFVNDGPFPPKVGIPTEYVVRWKLSDFGSDMENIVVSGRLAPGVKLTDARKIAVGELIEDNGVVRWTLPKILSGTGVLSGAPEAIFQVSFTPGETDIGREGIVITETSILAHDLHTASRFEDLLPPLTTGLEGDGTVKSGEGIILN